MKIFGKFSRFPFAFFAPLLNQSGSTARCSRCKEEEDFERQRVMLLGVYGIDIAPNARPRKCEEHRNGS